MNEETQTDLYIQNLQKDLMLRDIENKQLKRDVGEMSAFANDKTPNIIEYQLDLDDEKDRLFHLLSSHEVKRDNQTGMEIWKETVDDRFRVFSNFGVKFLMNIYDFYVTKGNLLSNLTEEQIQIKMYDMANELNDFIYTKYEFLLHYPKPEEFYNKYLPYISHTDLTQYELMQKCIELSNDELKEKFKHIPIVFMAFTDTIHLALLRAMYGEERTSLRKQTFVSQNPQLSTTPESYNKSSFSLMRPSTWKNQQ